jgi:hypothetical protein
MKKLHLILVLAISCLGLGFAQFYKPLPYHYRLASDPNLHGKGKDAQCMDYAIALSTRLAQKHIHGRLIFYHWHIRDTDITASHVFVVYYPNPNNPDETWIVDNEIRHPKQVSPIKPAQNWCTF